MASHWPASPNHPPAYGWYQTTPNQLSAEILRHRALHHDEPMPHEVISEASIFHLPLSRHHICRPKGVQRPGKHELGLTARMTHDDSIMATKNDA